MADDQVVTPAVTQGNATDARTATGEIKDQQGTQPAGSANQATKTSTTETPPASTDADKAAADKATADKAKAAPGAPDKYELKAPEGYEIDPKVLADAEPVFKELGLSNEAAQKLTDLWNKHSIESAEAPYKQYETMRNGWRDEIAKSTDLGDGKEGFKAEVRKNIDTAISAIGDPKAIADFKAAMDLTGAGDNPAMIHFINWASQFAVERARPVPAVVPKAPQTTSRAKRRYAGE